MKTPRLRLLLRLSLGALAIGLVLALVYARSRPSGAQAATQRDAGATARAVPVLLAPVLRRDVPVWLEGLGTVAAWQQVTVRSQVDGRLEKVFFHEGQVVHRGELLAQIDPRPFLVQLHQAEGALARDRAQLESGKLDLSRYRELTKQKLIAPQQVDQQQGAVGQATGAVEVDLAAVESARLNLDYARIKAPLDGVVGVRLVDPGNYVRAADTSGLVVITQLDPAAVFLTLPEDDLPRVSAAQKRGEVAIETWSRDGQARLGTGTLVVVDNQINQATATLRLKAMLANPDRKLWPNQFVKARVLVDTRRGALVIPAAAVQRGPQGSFVYVVGSDKTASLRPVEIELISGDTAVLARGLEAGEQVVVEGQAQLRPGTPLVPRTPSAPRAPGGPPTPGAPESTPAGGGTGGARGAGR
ncbi:MAG TPA: efflux RND transporter periplasmic adaptor subunit [Polyangia bacterium]|nr:efflux RND transporter periplasmic adaptor subunit [Polyangia bacterium]